MKATIEEIQWNLFELNGKVTELQGMYARIALNSTYHKATGPSRSSRFFGTYHLLAIYMNSFQDIASTRMACPDITYERENFDALESSSGLADDVLSLTNNEHKVVVRFKRW